MVNSERISEYRLQMTRFPLPHWPHDITGMSKYFYLFEICQLLLKIGQARPGQSLVIKSVCVNSSDQQCRVEDFGQVPDIE